LQQFWIFAALRLDLRCSDGPKPDPHCWRSRSGPRRNCLLLDGHECAVAYAMINPGLLDPSGRPYGQFGFFECIDDPEAARLLMAPALAWLRDRLPDGAAVLGPINFDTWHSYRLRQSGFDQPTFFMEPYNPPFYPALFSAMGFSGAARYVTKTIDHPAQLMAAWESHHSLTLRRGYRFRTIDRAAIDAELTLVR
jgi:hypothetical protein